MAWWRKRPHRLGQADHEQFATLEELAAEHDIEMPIGPGLEVQALVAAMSTERTEEQERVIAAARAKAQEEGVFDQILDNATATHGCDPTAGSDLANELDDVILEARLRWWNGDPSVELAIHKALTPVRRGRLGEKYARQAAILLRMGHLAALKAARAALAEFRELSDVDADDAGLYAYSALIAAEGLAATGEADQALRAAGEAVALFNAAQLPPVCVPDAVRALILLAECQAVAGQVEPARQSRAEAYSRLLTMPAGPPASASASMPAVWGLPIVDAQARDRLAQRIDGG